MQLLKYVSSLLPQFGKDRLEEDLRICRTEFETVTIPTYKNAEIVFGKAASSKTIQTLEKAYRSGITNFGRAPTMVVSVRMKLEEIVPTLALLEKFVEKDFENEIFVAGLTLKKANILRMLELARFVSTYSLRLLNYLYILESQERGAESGYVDNNMSKGEIKLIETHVHEFCIALNALARPENQVEKILKEIPEVLVNAQGTAALSTFGSNKTDPFGAFRVQGFSYNPIYHVGLIVAEIQSDKYKQARDLRSVLELRLLHLQKLQDGTPDAGLDREIDVIQSRIDKLSERIRKAEESVQ